MTQLQKRNTLTVPSCLWVVTIWYFSVENNPVETRAYSRLESDGTIVRVSESVWPSLALPPDQESVSRWPGASSWPGQAGPAGGPQAEEQGSQPAGQDLQCGAVQAEVTSLYQNKELGCNIPGTSLRLARRLLTRETSTGPGITV